MNFTGNSRIISNVEIEIENPIKDFQFLNNQEVSERIQTAVGNPIGKATSEVSLTQLEEVINAYPEVKSVRAYVSFSGRLHIRIKERRAIAQLINIKGDVCYLDSSMRMIPAKKNQQAPVIILNGHINQKIALGKKINAQWQAKLKDLLIFINQNSFWENHFEQCYVDKFSQLMLYPNIGRHSIVMNNVENIDEKFENLRLFYDKGLKHMGWDHYRSINISYRNQIVTTRNVSNTEHN
jgi:cell division protein FtsQ